MQRLWQSTVDSLKSLSRSRRQFAFIAAVVFVIGLLTALTSNRPAMMIQPGHKSVSNIMRESMPLPNDAPEAEDNLKTRTEAAQSLVSSGGLRASYFPTAPSDPRIAYSAELAVITKDFSRARSSMEEILDRHRGYTSRLRMVGHAGSSTLSAARKVPASEYPSALADLKSVGNVEQDEEAADEIVQQRGDIEARLQNAQNEERKLQLLLKDRDSKILDPAALDRRLTALHTDIVQMELQRTSSTAAPSSLTSISLSAKNTKCPSSLCRLNSAALQAPASPMPFIAFPRSSSSSSTTAPRSFSGPP